jgi:hypothetical protein
MSADSKITRSVEEIPKGDVFIGARNRDPTG